MAAYAQFGYSYPSASQVRSIGCFNIWGGGGWTGIDVCDFGLVGKRADLCGWHHNYINNRVVFCVYITRVVKKRILYMCIYFYIWYFQWLKVYIIMYLRSLQRSRSFKPSTYPFFHLLVRM